MLYTMIAVLVGLWLLGLFFRIAGALIHLLLVVAVVVFLYTLITGHSTGL